MNERLSEQWVREQLTQAGYTPVTSGATPKPGQYEEQKSNLAQVNRLLNTASKTGKGGVGRPEFIVHLGEGNILVVECKADPRDHVSPNSESVDPARYAVDGALHYAKAMSKSFTVVAVGVSGEGDKVDVYTHVKGSEAPTVLNWPSGVPVKEFLGKDELLNCVNHDPEKRLLDQQLLRAAAAELHVFLRNYAALAESEKPLIVAGSLIALTDEYFTGAYQNMDALNPSAKTSIKIGEEWVGAIDRVFADAHIPLGKTQMVVTAFRSALNNNPALLERGFRIKVKGSSKKVVDERSVLCAILDHLNEHVSDQFDLIGGFDIIGHFYGEFLKYTAGDKKGLGIVLTPPHITELFAELGEVNKDSVVLDPTAGTGGFLVAAMHKMITDCDTQDEQDNVKRNGLIGIEKMPSMFALAASNMLLRGDGKSNMYQGSCFDASVTNAVTGRATVGMINPPYSMGRVDSALTELRFIQHMLDMLQSGSTGIAIVPMSCAIGYQEVRTEILESHTLEAVMTMPSDLFYGVGTNTVIMVFTAHRPHNPKRPSWFAQWTDDGHITNRGRKEKYPGSWDEVRDRWVDEYHARQSVPGYSVAAGVTADDEWLAAAHMETDYAALNKRDFEKTLTEYAVYKLMREYASGSMNRDDFILAHIPELYFLGEFDKVMVERKSDVDVVDQNIDTSDWAEFRIGDLFDIKQGTGYALTNLPEGGTPLISARESDNSIAVYADVPAKFEANTITVTTDGAVGYATVQDKPFDIASNARALVFKGEHEPTVLAKLAVCTLIREEGQRFGYARKLNQGRLENMTVRLPAVLDESGDVMPDWDRLDAKMRELAFSQYVVTGKLQFPPVG